MDEDATTLVGDPDGTWAAVRRPLLPEEPFALVTGFGDPHDPETRITVPLTYEGRMSLAAQLSTPDTPAPTRPMTDAGRRAEIAISDTVQPMFEVVARQEDGVVPQTTRRHARRVLAALVEGGDTTALRHAVITPRGERTGVLEFAERVLLPGDQRPDEHRRWLDVMAEQVERLALPGEEAARDAAYRWRRDSQQVGEATG